MTENERYHGWTNRPTWLTSLWLNNERGSYRYWREAAKGVWQESETAKEVVEWGWSREEAASYLLAKRMRAELSQAAPTNAPDLFSDLLQAALDQIEWAEVADGFLEEFFEPSDDAEATQKGGAPKA